MRRERLMLNLERLLPLKNRLNELDRTITQIRNALEELLDSDEDMVKMYLSKRARGEDIGIDQHTEIEELLEAYYKEVGRGGVREFSAAFHFSPFLNT